MATATLQHIISSSSPLTLIAYAVTLLACASLALACALHAASRRKLAHIPSPFSLPLLGHVPYLLTAPWERFWDFCRATPHGIALVYVWTRPLVCVSDPALVKRICVSERFKYPKDDWSYDFFRDVLGHGLVTSEGDAWRAQRALVSPAFHFKALERLAGLFNSAAERFTGAIDASIDRPTPGEHAPPYSHIASVGGGVAQVELSTAFRTVTLEIISALTLGLQPADASVFPHLFEAVVDELNARVFQPWRAFLPHVQIRYARKLAALNGIVRGIIATRRASRAATVAAAPAAVRREAAEDDTGVSLGGTLVFANGADMLDMLLDSGVELSDTAVADEIKTQLMAGHETSSMMLTWSAYLLAAHPRCMAEAVREVDAQLGLAPGVTASTVPGAVVCAEPTFDQFKSLEYLHAVFKEAMRLYTPVPVLNRECVQDDDLNGVRIPAGTGIIISIWGLHNNPDIWGPDTGVFRPERFTAEEAKARHAFAHMPFSSGPRNCIGQNLAIMEAKVLMGHLLRNYNLSLAPGSEHVHMDTKTLPLRPRERVYMRITRRK